MKAVRARYTEYAMDVEAELSEKRVERNVMEAELDDDALAESERYHKLESRIEELRTELDGC